MANIVLDIAFNSEIETIDTVLDGIRKQHDVTTVVLHEAGSGGGWPEVRFTGTREQLTEMIDTHWVDENTDSLEFFCEAITD